MALLISSAVLMLLGHFLSSPASATASTGTVSTTWITDLGPALPSKPVGTIQGRKREWQGLPRTSLWFLDNDTILATFITQERTNPSLANRGSTDPNLPLRLRAVFLQAETGKIISTQAWPSESRTAGVVAVNDGKFVTQRGTTLTLYSSDSNELKKVTLPTPPEDHSDWYAHASPTGKALLFSANNYQTTSPKPWIWVDTSRLQIVRSWTEVQSGRFGISDNMVAMAACYDWEYHCQPNLEVRGVSTEWATITQIEKQPGGGGPHFINNDTLFLSGAPWRLLNTGGKVVFIEGDSKGGGPITSAGGQRFVVPSFKVVGRIEALDIGGHGELESISVYDSPFHERSYRLDVNGPRIRSISNKSVADLALSPDGSKLAILYDEAIYLFQLPTPAPRPVR